MKRATLLAIVALNWVVASDNRAVADMLSDYWPTCGDPAAVRPAKKADTLKNFEEVERLGCVLKTPRLLRVRVIRCEPSGMSWFPNRFPYPIRSDATLPESMCEVETWLPDGWRATLYTHYMNVVPTH